MDDEKYLVAVASSDGIVINSHFGRASFFYIYEVDEKDEIRLKGYRNVEPVCDGGNHDDHRLQETLAGLADCKYLLVSRIGYGAQAVAQSLGIIPMELPGEIKESINELIKYQKIQSLFG